MLMTKKKTTKELRKQDLLDLIPVMTIEEGANYFDISRFTLSRLAKELEVVPKPAQVGRPSIKLI